MAWSWCWFAPWWPRFPLFVRKKQARWKYYWFHLWSRYLLFWQRLYLICAVVRQSDNDPFAFGLCVGCSGGRKFVLVNHGILLFIFVSLALGLLISSVTRTQVAAMLVSGLMLMMPTMLLSGMIFPIESMPVILQWISDILPARWYIQAVRKLMIEGVPVALVYKEIGILLLMATVLITISIKKFKYRLE